MNNIKKRRKECKMSQREVAEQLGIDTSTVAKWETGASKPRVDTLVKLAGIYKCPVGELLGTKTA